MNGRQDSIEARGLRLAKALAPAAVVVGTTGAGVLAGPQVGVLVLAGSALVGSIGWLWSSLRALVGETALAPEDAFALGAPSSEEEQKRAVLRAIKDIEFERAVGKLSEEDYAVLVARYRAEAKRLLRQIDESRAPERARAEKLAAAHLAKAGAAVTERASDDASSDDGADDAAEEADEAERERPSPKAKKGGRAKGRPGKRATSVKPAAAKPAAPRRSEGDDEAVATRTCAGCDATNDADAVFCKACGARLASEEEPA